MSQRLKIFFVTIGIVTLVAVVLWPLMPVTTSISKNKLPHTFLKRGPAEESPYKQSPQEELSEAIYTEAIRAGQVDNDPVATEARLNEIAGKLSSDELEALANVVKTPSDQGDLRSVAVDLLARAKSEEVLVPLQEIIFSQWPENQDGRLNDFERALRTRAVEGIQDNPSNKAVSILSNACETMEDRFLSDQNCRAFMFRQGKAGSLEDQHKEALEKIIEN
jgi:hypothetical protein